MTLRQFLDAAYTALVDGRIAQGVPLTDALEKLAKYAARSPKQPAPNSALAIARRNTENMRRLGGMLGT